MLCGKTDRKGKFQTGSVDTFVTELEDVGEEIEKIRIGHDNSGLSIKKFLTLERFRYHVIYRVSYINGYFCTIVLDILLSSIHLRIIFRQFRIEISMPLDI